MRADDEKGARCAGKTEGRGGAAGGAKDARAAKGAGADGARAAAAEERGEPSECALGLDEAEGWRYEDEWPCLDEAAREDVVDVDVIEPMEARDDLSEEPACRRLAVERDPGPGGADGGGVDGAPAKPKPRGARNKELGAKGELAAALFLERRGEEIVERNWRCPAGEADLIARDDRGTVVFVEVKTRTGVERGFPAEAVTPARRRRYERIAGYYLSDHVFEDARVRFDVLSILTMESRNRAYVRHHIDAFGVG